MATVPSQQLRSPARSVVADFVTLTKPRIMLLILITAYGSMAFAAGGLPPVELTLATLFGLGLSSGGASALNHYWDRDIDALMHRTSVRPIPAGRVAPDTALGFGIGLIGSSFAVLAVYVNLLTALLAVGGAAFYVLVYTIWLKRRTPQNIVIGGAAGAVPPLVGWAAVTGDIGMAAIFISPSSSTGRRRTSGRSPSWRRRSTRRRVCRCSPWCAVTARRRSRSSSTPSF